MLNIGIVGCSEIAYRRFMPAALKVPEIKVRAVAEEYAPEKLETFCGEYNLEADTDFEHLIHRKDVNAIYVPQPPALHYKWAKLALECGKHVFVEKPSTIDYAQTEGLVSLAREKRLALHENYMFRYHSQIAAIRNMLADGVIGDVRLIRGDFGFPLRQKNDFRYNKELGGGALLDAGGYVLKLASILLGDTVHVDTARLSGKSGYEVDMYGAAMLSNENGLVFQAGFGMDCGYRCSLEVWGSKGRLVTNRIFTAPPEYVPVVLIENAEGEQKITLEADAHFVHSIEAFCKETMDDAARESMYKELLLQARLVTDVRRLGMRGDM